MDIDMKSKKDIEVTLAEFITSILEKKSIDFNLSYDDNIYYLGIDSIEYINLIIKLEENFEIEFGDEIMDKSKYNSIDEITKYILKLIERNS